MNRSVQILMLVAIMLPLLGVAREETLAERKQRITRKYLRERMKVTRSDMVVPDAAAEDERVTDSSQFKDVDIGLERQEPGTVPPPRPPQARPLPVQDDRNWLLDDAEDGTDPYADPFDPYASSDTDKKNDYWALWGGRSEEADQKKQDRTRVYDPNTRREQVYDSRTQEIIDPRAPANNARRDIFGKQAPQTPTTLFGSTVPKTYGSSPESGLLKTPSVRSAPSELDLNRQKRESQGYTPYKNPYQTDRTTPQQGMGEVPKVEYKKPDSYQQWKKRNKAWDPTSDDAYIDELMQKHRR